MDLCGYLDIETTSLDPSDGDLTVIGLYLDDDREQRIVQLVGNEISAAKILETFERVKVLYTYNGERFDLPYIKAKLGVDLARSCLHKDLMYECWRRNLYGGLKEVERQLGIKRELTGIDGRAAVQLWFNYKSYGDKRFLTTLLEYNREDVLNLRVLRQKLSL
ncbi:MAG: ribonuclease H-like domain-containing protein [Candidatus Binatia bacterium]